MMEALRTWLYGVFCAALLLTLIQGLLPKGKFRSYASLAGDSSCCWPCSGRWG